MEEPPDPPEQPPASEGAAARPKAPGAKSEPFWNSKAFIAALALIGAAVGPVTTWVSKRAELDLAREDHLHATGLAVQEQQHKIRMDYFSRAIDPSLDASYRQRVLRFLRRSKDDPSLKGWAEEELRDVDSEIERLRREREVAEAQIARLRSTVSTTTARAAQQVQAERVARAAAESESLNAGRCISGCNDEENACESQCLRAVDLLRPVGADTASRTLAREDAMHSCQFECRQREIRCTSNCLPISWAVDELNRRAAARPHQ
jgi:hypothetical protein